MIYIFIFFEPFLPSPFIPLFDCITVSYAPEDKGPLIVAGGLRRLFVCLPWHVTTCPNIVIVAIPPPNLMRRNIIIINLSLHINLRLAVNVSEMKPQDAVKFSWLLKG